MAALELKFLGDLAVIRDGESVPLPPSRKTRALLAYLALNRRAFRREHLCELFWEVPDDPRGSLRWSLSKLRRLVDDEARPRILADRVSVGFDASDVSIDVTALFALAGGDADRVPLEALEDAAERYCGMPLEGVELPDFHGFDAWCTGERERVMRAQQKVLSALIRRLGGDPDRALPHARTWVRLAPYDEAARATLIGVLLALGRPDQAAQEHRTGLRILADAGIAPTGALDRALRDPARLPTAEARTGSEDVRSVPRASLAIPPVCVREPPSAALFGRDRELTGLLAAVAQASCDRAARLVLVSGEPGIGKSRLLEAAAQSARASGALVVEVAAYESESVRPFALWIDALRKLDPDAGNDVFGTRDSANRERFFEGLSDVVAGATRVRTLVLVFDDVHWSDESSAAALHYIARTNRDRPLVVLLAARDDELRDNTPVLCAVRGLRQAGLLDGVRLGPLPSEALRQLIGARVPGEDGERLGRECGGNPLFAIELARAEAAGGGGPSSLGDLVQERLARLDEESADVLRWAAVLAPHVDTAMLARITGLDWSRIEETLEAAARRAMLIADAKGHRFSHDLIARAILAGLSPAQRRTMHRRVAEALEADARLDPSRAADLAHHASQSGDAGLAARAMVSAGRLCLRFFANDEAQSLARRGLACAESLPAAERICRKIELDEILLAAAPLADWRRSAREYAELAEAALDHGALSHARRAYHMASYVHWAHGSWTGAREGILESERVARGGDDEVHIVGIAEAARCLAMLERDLVHADAMLMEAQALAQRRDVCHHAIPGALGLLRFHENRLDEAAGFFRDARTLARSSGDRLSEFQAHEYLAMIEIERGDWAGARACCGALIELGEKLREGSERPFAHALGALCAYAMDDGDAALVPALAALRAADAKHRLAYTLTRAALIDIERGHAETAIARAREALTCAEALERASEVVVAHVALARAFALAGDRAEAERHVAALAAFDTVPVASWARDRAAALSPSRSPA